MLTSRESEKLFIDGLKTGLLLEIGGMGPICLLVFRLSLSLPLTKLIIGIIGITLADIIYISLAVFSISVVIKKLKSYQRVFDVVVGTVLIIVGVLFITAGHVVDSPSFQGRDLFLWLFGLNIANPITILFITGIFSLEISKRNMDLKKSGVFAFGFLLATPIFMIFVCLVGSIIGRFLPSTFVHIINVVMGCVLVILGIRSIIKNREMNKMHNTIEDDIRELFKVNSALLNGHFKLSSGLHSDTYFQSALILQHPKEAERLGEELAKKIKENNIKVDVVVSPSIGGIVIGQEMGRALSVRAIFTERVDGKVLLRRGFSLSDNEKVLVVEDVITTGLSTREVIEVLKVIGVQVVAIASLVDRSAGKVDFGVPRFSLLSLEIKNYKEENCLMCKEGTIAIKPGSRK
jgi:orotate phosphoribosyltransferase